MADQCTGLSPQSLSWCDGKINLPGIRSEVYCIPKRDIVRWPVLPETYAIKMSELATYAGSFVLAENKKWQTVSVLVDKSPVSSESQGSKPSKTCLNKATFVHAGTEEEATAFCALANNDDYVYIIQVKKGKYRIIGNEMYQTETNPSQTLGGAPTDEMNTKLEVSVTDQMPAPFYSGVIETENGDINMQP